MLRGVKLDPGIEARFQEDQIKHLISAKKF